MRIVCFHYLVAEGFPIKQGLKLFNSEAILFELSEVAEGFPIKQGLKLKHACSMFFICISCRRISNKTRIETSEPYTMSALMEMLQKDFQ